MQRSLPVTHSLSASSPVIFFYPTHITEATAGAFRLTVCKTNSSLLYEHWKQTNSLEIHILLPFSVLCDILSRLMWYGYSAQTSAEAVISLPQLTLCVCAFIIIAFFASCQVFVEHLANWLSHALALSANRYFVNEYSREISPSRCLCSTLFVDKICKRRERQLAFLPHCLITFCACTYTETRACIYSGGEWIHTLPRLQSYARHLLMKWLFLRDGSANALPPTFSKRKNWEKRTERCLIVPVCFMPPTTP